MNAILRKLILAYIQNTERFKKDNLSIFTINNDFRETEPTVKPPVSHAEVLRSQFQTRFASVSDCVT